MTSFGDMPVLRVVLLGGVWGLATGGAFFLLNRIADELEAHEHRVDVLEQRDAVHSQMHPELRCR